MAKVKAIDVSTDAGLPSGWTGTTRSTVATVQDHEGLIKNCLAEETRVHKGRRVENLVEDSEDWTGNTNIYLSGVTRAANLLTFTDAGGYVYERPFATTAIKDHVYCFSITLGTSSTMTNVGLRLSGSGSGSQYISLTPSTYSVNTRVTVTLTQAATGYLDFGFDGRVAAGGNGSATGTIDVVSWQLEDVTGQTNQNPSEYVSVGVVKKNLLEHSEDLGDTYWQESAYDPTVTANSTEYVDRTTADTIEDDNASQYESARKTTASLAAGTYCFSVRFKKTTSASSFPGLGINGASAMLAAIDTDNGTITARSGFTPDYLGIATDPDDSDYWRAYVAETLASANTIELNIYPAVNTDASATWSASTTGSVVAVGAQLEAGTSPGTYQYVDTDDTFIYHGVGVDGVQYFATTNPWTVSGNVATEGSSTALTGMSILLEPQGENLCKWSQAFQASDWLDINSGTGSANPVVSTNYATAPDGTATAERIQFDRGTDSGGYSITYQAIASLSNSTAYTRSFYVKANSGTPTIVTYFANTAFDPGALEIQTTTLGSEWQRIEATATTVSAGTGTIVIGLRGSDFVSGCSETADISIWGAQLEAGSKATSYIETENGSVTRTADTAPYAPLTTPQSAGTVVLGVDGWSSHDPSTNDRILGFSDTSQYGPMYGNSSPTGCFFYDGTSSISNSITNSDSCEYLAAMWGTNSRALSHYSNAAWDTWVTSASYDGDLHSTNQVFIGGATTEVIYRPLKVKALDIYDDEKTESWIESNYPPSAGGGSMPPIMRHRINLMSN